MPTNVRNRPAFLLLIRLIPPTALCRVEYRLLVPPVEHVWTVLVFNNVVVFFRAKVYNVRYNIHRTKLNVHFSGLKLNLLSGTKSVQKFLSWLWFHTATTTIQTEIIS